MDELAQLLMPSVPRDQIIIVTKGLHALVGYALLAITYADVE